MDQEKIGRFIASCRKEKGLTQAQLGEKLGISNRAVSKWETGKSCPDPSVMLELCRILGISANELLSGEKCIGAEVRSEEDDTPGLDGMLTDYKRRIIINNAFFIIIAVFSAFAAPLALIFVVAVAAFRDYCLFKNMRSVRRLIEKSPQ